MGKETWFWNLNTPADSRKEFLKFYKEGETVLFTFNFIGLSGEEQFETEKHSTLWEKYKIPCWCMMVDHPMYYYKQLSGNKQQFKTDMHRPRTLPVYRNILSQIWKCGFCAAWRNKAAYRADTL